MIKNLIALLAVCGFSFATQAQTTSQPREDFASAHIELAASYFAAGKTDTAFDEIQKVIAKEPKNSPANELLGLMQMKAGNFAEAEAHFKIAITSNPTNGSAHSNYGTLLCQQSRYEAGMEEFGKALQYPKYIKIAQTLVNGGICLQQKGDPVSAEKFLLKSLEQEPFMPAALYQLSKVYFSTNRLDLAESRLTALHKQVQPNAASTFLLYQIAIAKGNGSQAQSHAKTLVTRFPDSPEASLVKQ